MSNEIGEDNSIENFISTALTQIKSALPPDAKTDGIIIIEMSTVILKDKSGKFDIKVLNFGAEAAQNQIQKITIPIRILSGSEKMMEEAKIAKAKADIASAEHGRKMAERMSRGY